MTANDFQWSAPGGALAGQPVGWTPAGWSDRGAWRVQLAWRFFLENAGGMVGRRAESALALARAEREGALRGWRVEWAPEWDCGCRVDAGPAPGEVAGCGCVRGAWTDRPGPRGEVAGPGGFLPGECECEVATLYDDSGWPNVDAGGRLRADGGRALLASLGGVCGASNAYRRVVAAELMGEALAPEWARVDAERARWDCFLARVAGGSYGAPYAPPSGARGEVAL